MSRIVKKPEDRKSEIMEVAWELFSAHGYEQASVNLIVERAGVAKGTFYHYFQSKEDILAAILENYMEQFASQVKTILNDKGLTTFHKLQFIMNGLLSGGQLPDSIGSGIEDKKDAKLHSMLEEKFIEKFHPILLDVLQQGNSEGIFTIAYPSELTEILLIGIRGYMHIHLPKFQDDKYKLEKLAALEELFNKLLGSEHFKFKFSE